MPPLAFVAARNRKKWMPSSAAVLCATDSLEVGGFVAGAVSAWPRRTLSSGYREIVANVVNFPPSWDRPYVELVGQSMNVPLLTVAHYSPVTSGSDIPLPESAWGLGIEWGSSHGEDS